MIDKFHSCAIMLSRKYIMKEIIRLKFIIQNHKLNKSKIYEKECEYGKKTNSLYGEDI